MKWALFVLALMLAVPSAAAHETGKIDSAVALAQSKAAIGRPLPDLTFTDVKGKPFRLAALKGKPVLVSLVYTGCTDICPLIIDHLYKAVEVAQDALGKDAFTTLTIGFDVAHDTPERMLSFARARGVDLPNWYFLSAEQDSIDQLSSTTGFTIIPTAGGFGHMAQVTIADQKGVISAQVFGGDFSPQAIVEPLKAVLSGNTQGGSLFSQITQRIRLFCTVYNPNTGRYYVNYSIFIALAIGLASLGAVATWLVREFRRPDGSA